MIDKVIGDLRYALRTFVKAPTFTVGVVATIALAVGATTAVFAVVDHILLRPLPFQDSERVVALCETNAAMGNWCGASPLNVADLARSASTLERAGVARTESFIAQGDSGSYVGMGAIVSPGFLEVLRIRPMLGRLIEERDLPRGSNHVVVVSREFWQQRLGSDPTIVGRSIVLDQTPFTIVGVLPAGAWMPNSFPDVQIWKPLTASIDNVGNRRWRGFTALGRMAPHVSQDELLSELTVIESQLAAAYPDANRDWRIRLVNLREKTVGDVSATLWIFLGTAAFVLLIACANVAGLFLVRASGRAPEFAVRASLGAGRSRLVQQLMTESLVLSLVGGAFGLLLAVWTTSAFVAVAPANIPRLTEVGIDSRIVLFVFGVATLIAMFFGIVPARRAWKADLNGPLKGLRSGNAGDSRLRAAFTVVQLALALMLLFGAGLLTRSFTRFMQWDPGFERANIVTTWMLPPKLGDIHATVSLMEQVRDEVAGIPGVQSAGLGSFARQLVSPRFNMLLVASFAMVALLLAAVGVYGVMASSVASRTREFGIRVALGARPEQLVRNVVSGGMALTATGIVLGCAGALVVGGLLTSLLYGLPARDPLTLAGSVAVLAFVAFIASWTPARRASRMDPVVALRAH